ncbi:PAS domain S-box protein [Hyphomicrobium facile]|uniref:Blue-light-activated histidine kinase n=1 Tax=Hyphomicrobium facile TaxID=51670 RepID=A0A1I7NR01_9HYPH|nr:PAS domain S-box protein [Hyphomicrobium facile]SFV37096.1 PAS domain S-box-containing protein [Hyphomicrobium facile]
MSESIANRVRSGWPAGSGEMAERIRCLDWASTPLGPTDSWPSNLIHTVEVMLAAGVQIVLFWGPQYVALYNDTYAPTIGRKHPAALGRPAIENWRELWDDLEPLLRSVRLSGQTVVAKDRPFYIERNGYGEHVFFDISYSAVPDEVGNVAGVMCIVNETTTRVAAERAQREAEAAAARLAAIVQSSDDAIVSKDLNGIITSWNEGAQRLFGYTADEVIGKPITMLIPSDRQDEEVNILARIRRGERTKHFETKRRRRDGSIFDISLTISPVKDRDGNIIGASKIGRDITERKRAQETQALLIGELNHRVKNTLASVQAIAQQTLRRARSSEDFVSSFSGRIQSLARVHTLLGATSWRSAELGELVRDQLRYGAIDEARVTSSGPQVQLGPQTALHLAMMLHELATNAIKYGALSVQDGRVLVEWSVDDSTLHLRWRESGSIPVRVSGRRGFGSTLIEQSAKGEGGSAHMRISADGISWDVDLPLPRSAFPAPETGPEAQPAALPPLPAPKPTLNGKRVLIIEDEPLVALDLQDTLLSAGAVVVAMIASAPDALNIVKSERLDAAVLDGNLHGKPVDEIAAALTRSNVPFVFISGYGRESLPRGFGDAPLLNKPFSSSALLEATTRLFEAREGTIAIRRL